MQMQQCGAVVILLLLFLVKAAVVENVRALKPLATAPTGRNVGKG